MMGLASPTGYLDLTQPAITAAGESGTETIDDVPVTDYVVSVDVARLALAPGITPEETTVIDDALALLRQQGYQYTTVTVAIDAAGFIRRATSVTNFADGGSVTLVATLSNYDSSALESGSR